MGRQIPGASYSASVPECSGQLIFGKGSKRIKWERIIFSANVAGATGQSDAQNPQILPHVIYKINWEGVTI